MYRNKWSINESNLKLWKWANEQYLKWRKISTKSKFKENMWDWIRHELLKNIESGEKYKIILDLGCGNGRILSPLIREKIYSKVIGIDPDIESLMEAKCLKDGWCRTDFRFG
jgi:2-polyprenyl-3-methyl-5-hydroxy-6-metoxy-1,4-benzoquinol methylase